MSSEPERQAAEPKRIVGLATRTTNAAESDPSTAQIATLWEQFTRGRWSEQLEDFGAFGPTMAVYSAYESDVTGSYQLLVGRQVRDSRPVSAPLQVVLTARGSYLVFRCSGPLPQAIMDGWRDVWACFARDNAPARAYTTDFEIYADRGPVEIWVGVRDR
ncbi:MAG TPA: GyrI-like domain-containing protein [Gemmatimonadales bacterium]|nr:GyrI-like domain-containing protein [Gemmatimonadales bacterium]